MTGPGLGPPEEIARLIAALRSAPSSVIEDAADFVDVRARLDAAALTAKLPAGCRVETSQVGGRTAEKLTPAEAVAGRRILYLHGGGYCLGGAASHRALAARLAVAAGAQVVLPEYRLAPEHPFPAALEDAVAACDELTRGGEDFAIAGDSAGGGLALAAACAARDAGLPPPLRLALISPWADLRLTGASLTAPPAADPVLSPAQLAAFAWAYLGATPASNPLASPVLADLRGLPPMLIQAGGAEILLSDATALADAAAMAGCAVRLEVWPKMIHVWHAYSGQLTAGRLALDGAGRWLAAGFEEHHGAFAR